MKKPDNTLLNPQPAALGLDATDVSLSTYYNYSFQLLQFSKMFTELSASFEEKHSGEELTSALTLEYQANVTSAIFSAWFFFDATINELLWTALNSPNIIEDLGASDIQTIACHSKFIIKKSSPLAKSDLILRCLNKTYDKEDPIYKNAILLKKLRNALVHYVPEWTGTDLRELVPGLALEILPSPFFGEAYPYFPDRCLSFDCARWSIRTVCLFIDDFYERIGIEPRQHYLEIRSELKALVDMTT